MPRIENKVKWCVNKAKKEGSKHRGLKEVEPDDGKARKHMDKANHNLKAAIYLVKGNFSDWAVSGVFYSMYHCLIALLAKHGYEPRNQECAFAAVEHLINKKKISIDVKWLRRISSFGDDHNADDIITLREEFQYGTDAVLEEPKIKKLLNDAKEFIEIVREELYKPAAEKSGEIIENARKEDGKTRNHG